MIDLVFFGDLEELKKYGEKLGIDSYIIAENFKDEKELLELKDKIKKEKLNFKICKILEKPDSRELNFFKGKADFIAVRGSSVALNNFAVSNRGIDFLLQPVGSGKLEFDTAIARVAADRAVPIAFLFSEYLNANPFQRSLLFKNSFLAVKLMKRFKANAFFFSGAKEVDELRAVEDLSSFAVMLGFSREQGIRFVKDFAKEELEK